MPPQPGVFAVPYASTHKGRLQNGVSEPADMNGSIYTGTMAAGPSRVHGTPSEDPKTRKRKDMSGRIGKEVGERREEVHYNSQRHYADAISELTTLAYQLSTHPEAVAEYQLRMLPLTTERSALLASLVTSEKYALECVQMAFTEEQERVEEEWKKGREKIKERLLEGIEERRKRAREEKDGEGPGGDASLDTQSRPHITRKLRNKLGGTSPPPTPLANGTPGGGGIASIASGPITSGPFLNPHSLSVDELPSPFPLPLTSTHSSNNNGTSGNGRRRNKGNARETMSLGTALGKSGQGPLEILKLDEIETDMIIFKRSKKRRLAASGLGK